MKSLLYPEANQLPVFWLFILIAGFIQTIQAQDLRTARTNSPYTYIYKLPKETYKLCYTDKAYFDKIDSKLTSPVDSFLTDSGYKKASTPGIYLCLSANENKLTYEIRPINEIEATLFNNKHDLTLYIYHKQTGSAVANAEVILEGKPIAFDSTAMAYIIPYSRRTGLLEIYLGEEALFYYIKHQRVFVQFRRRVKNKSRMLFNKVSVPFNKFYYRLRYSGQTLDIAKTSYHYNYTPRYNGYIAFNKPKYMPNDTLKAKAFFIKGKHKTLEHDVKVFLCKKGFEEKARQITWLHPAGKGSYNFNFVLRDSLKLNTWYTIIFRDKKNMNYIMSKEFYLEDYQLNETSYNLVCDKKEYNLGEHISLYASGKDANGMNLLDARVELKLKVVGIEKFEADEVFVPNTLWKCERKLDPLGQTRLDIPDSVLPEASMKLKLEATFNNSNNETHDTTITLLYLGSKEYIKTQMDSNLIKAYLVINGTETAGKGRVDITGPGNLNERIDISYPYTASINPAASGYIFTANLAKKIFNPDPEGSLVSCSTLRTADSVFVSISNPRRLPIEYSLFKNGSVLVERGAVLELDKKIRDTEESNYMLFFHYVWAGQTIDENRTIILFKDNLQVNIEQPDRIFPGQTTSVKIKVTDAANNPVEGVDLTAGAINNQFGYGAVPRIPYLGKSIKNAECINSFTFYSQSFSGEKSLSDAWRKRMQLDSMAYYRFIYPAEGIRLHYDTILDGSSAQVSPFLYKKGEQQPIYLVSLDYRAVNYFNSTNCHEYVFVAAPGYHTLSLRAYDKTYTLDSVFLKKGWKLDLSLDVENPPKWVRISDAPTAFSNYERDLIRKSTLILNKRYYDKDIWLWQNDRVFSLKNYNNSYSVKLCGFTFDTINYRKDNNFECTFPFEPGYEYSVYKGLVKMHERYYDEVGELPKLLVTKQPGLRACVLQPVAPQKKYNSLRKFYTYNPTHTTEGYGTLRFDYTGDSLISLVRLASFDSQYARFVDGFTRDIFNLKPGFYNLVLVTGSKYFLTRKKIYIAADGITYHRFGDFTFEHLDQKDSMLIPEWDTLIKPNINMYEDYSSAGKAIYHRYYDKYGGAIRITVTDKKTKEAIPFANAVVYEGNTQVATGTADFDGNIIIKPLRSGKYSVKVIYLGYQTQEITNLMVYQDKYVYLPVFLFNDGVALDQVEIVDYKIPLIDAESSSGMTIDREDFLHMANKSVGGIASTSAGVFQQDMSFDVYIRGSRSGASNVFIDGERVIGTMNTFQYDENIFIPESPESDKAPDSKDIRNKFSDYAYWQPALVTDVNGEASFSATFPDNATSWKSFALAMDSKRHSGSATKITKAYKNVMANMALPRFLLEGDSASAIGKILNYTPNAHKVKSFLMINKKSVFAHDTLLESSIIEKVCLKAETGQDTLQASYAITLNSGESDGESRNIPVLPLGAEEATGSFLVLNGDTTLETYLPEGENKVYAINNPVDQLLKDLDEIKKYPYWCMEQTASKLNALLMEKSIRKSMKQPFKEEKTIETLIRKLEKGQKENGSWGWWEDSPENVWMTSYISAIMSKAEKEGYNFKNKEKTIRYLAWNIHASNGNELLTVLNTLSEMKLAIPYDDYMKKTEKDTLNLYQQLLKIKILQENNLLYNASIIEREKKQTLMGSYYWGDDSYRWYDNSINTTLLVYKILEKRDARHPYLSSIRNYFLEIKKDGRWRNTIESAKILETILPELIKNSGNTQSKSSISFLNLSIASDSFPFSSTINSSGGKIGIKKTGTGPVFLTIYQKTWNPTAIKKSDYYEVNAWFEENGKKVDTLKQGTLTDLVVEVNAKHKGEFVMIEIPIPAGCSYDDNKAGANPLECHREYFKHKTSVFCEYLPKGKHLFVVHLQPRFSGRYSLNPSTTELMYFPVFYGRTGPNKITIK